MNYKVLEVTGTREWKGDKGTVIYYTMRLEGSEKPASLGQKPEKPAPKPGDVLDLTLTENDKFPSVLTAKRVGNFGGNAGGGPRPTDPKAVAGMQRSHSQEMALMYVQAKVACGALQTFEWDDVVKLADAFLKDVQRAVESA